MNPICNVPANIETIADCCLNVQSKCPVPKWRLCGHLDIILLLDGCHSIKFFVSCLISRISVILLYLTCPKSNFCHMQPKQLGNKRSKSMRHKYILTCRRPWDYIYIWPNTSILLLKECINTKRFLIDNYQICGFSELVSKGRYYNK